MKKISLLFVLSLIVLSALLLSIPQQAEANIPAGVTGKVEFQLPDGTRVPATGVKIFRTDFWSFPYCEGNSDVERSNKCWGVNDGVEVIVDANGIWSMANDGNNPGIISRCTEEGGATRCATGPKGRIDYNPPETVHCHALNWCGFNCGSNPHRIEAYFPNRYRLPGNLSNLGYSHERGSWSPTNGIIDSMEVGNNMTINNINFVFLLDPPTVGPSCNNIQVTDAQGNDLPADADASFIPGNTYIKFRCGSTQPDQVHHYKFNITSPSGVITTLTSNAGGGTISSEAYLITESGRHNANCQICTSPDFCIDNGTAPRN